MPGQHTEQAFETAIEDWLINSGGYDQDRTALISAAVTGKIDVRRDGG